MDDASAIEAAFLRVAFERAIHGPFMNRTEIIIVVANFVR
jgi:hypothetical protein